jgi:sugar/nucleoside kinase (ribokinase family)
MEADAQVVTLGHAIVDVLARCDDDEIRNFGLEKGTMALVEGRRAEELYEAIVPEVEVSGGSAANTASALASLGARVRFVGRVAGDGLGRVFTEDIRSAGVDFDGAGVDRPPAVGEPGTGRCLVLVTPDAEKTMCTNLGAGAALAAGDVDAAAVAAARVVYLEGYLWGPPATTAAAEKAIDSARRSGALVAFSASDPAWVGLHRDAMVALLDRVDILFANQPEALGLSGCDDLDGAVEALARRVATVAVTLGADGCIVAGPGGLRTRVPAEPVTRVVDTTGAGDSFAAGFLYGVVNDLGAKRSARLGGVAAAEVVGHLGARPQTRLSDLAQAAGII